MNELDPDFDPGFDPGFTLDPLDSDEALELLAEAILVMELLLFTSTAHMLQDMWSTTIASGSRPPPGPTRDGSPICGGRGRTWKLLRTGLWSLC